MQLVTAVNAYEAKV